MIILARRSLTSTTRLTGPVPASRYIRALLLIALAAFGVVLAARVAGVCDGIEHLAPALLLALPLLAGRYVGEDKLVALAERFQPSGVVRVARLTARLPRAPRVAIARGGALLAAGLAERGPPAVLLAR